MKALIYLALLAVSSAEVDFSAPEWNVDLSQYVPVEELPGFWDNREISKAYHSSVNVRSRNARIIGGEEAFPHFYPYQVALNMQFATGGGLCGGSLIGSRTILTAAHCPINSLSTLVIAGVHNRNAIEPRQQRQTVPSANYRLHESYNTANFNNDIAILVAPADWMIDNIFIGTIALPRALLGESFAGMTATSIGWGRTSQNGQLSDVLRVARSQIITNAACAAVFGSSLVNDGVICIETAQSQQGICFGDSGGVLSVEHNGQSLQVGISTFVASGGCVAGFPSGATRTTFFDSWIHERINEQQ